MLILSVDEFYTMDYCKMLAEHVSISADFSIACVELPVSDTSGLGVVQADAAGRVLGFQEKPVKTARIPGIDAFILHRHVDHGQEGGLRLGLWTRDPSASFPAAPKARKKIYELFRAADTPAWEEASAFALPVIGIQRWEDLR